MVYDGILFSIIVGLLRGGNLKGFANLKLKYGWMFPVLLLIQIVVFALQSKADWIAAISNSIILVIYGVGLIFLWLNRDQTGFPLVFIGVLLNFLVMAVNGGRMPVSLEAATVLDPKFLEMLKEGSIYAKHQALTDSTWLGFLGDIIPLSSPYPRAKVISIGDVIMNIGIFFFIQKQMISAKPDNTLVLSPEETAKS